MLQDRSILVLVACAAALCLSAAPFAAANPDQAPSIEETVKSLIDLIRYNYVIPERVDAIEERLLSGIESGDYQSYTDLLELSKRITSDLRDASDDLHFGIRPKPPESQRESAPAPSPTSANDTEKGTAREPVEPAPPVTGLGRIETLEGTIGYLEIKAFPDPALGGAAVDEAFAELASSSALILDLRTSRGGHPGMVAYLLSYFFEGEPFLFNRLHWPNSNKSLEFETLADLPSPRFADRDVFLLTSRHTPSAAEGFSYHMKHLGRARLVGEPTAGAAHLNQGFELPGFQVLIPTGRPLSPITNGNWEGVGVIPHHEVPAEDALRSALLLASGKRLEN